MDLSISVAFSGRLFILSFGLYCKYSSFSRAQPPYQLCMNVMYWPRVYKTIFMLNSTEHEFFQLKNVKMTTIDCMFTFMTGKTTF